MNFNEFMEGQPSKYGHATRVPLLASARLHDDVTANYMQIATWCIIVDEYDYWSDMSHDVNSIGRHC